MIIWVSRELPYIVLEKLVAVKRHISVLLVLSVIFHCSCKNSHTGARAARQGCIAGGCQEGSALPRAAAKAAPSLSPRPPAECGAGAAERLSLDTDCFPGNSGFDSRCQRRMAKETNVGVGACDLFLR